MLSIVQERVKALAQALADTEEYKNLVNARLEVQRHEAARIMLRDLRKLQAEIERKQTAGEPVTEEDWKHLEQRSQLVAFNPYVRDLLQAEMAFAQLMMEVQAALAEALGLKEEPDEGEERGDGGSAPKTPSGGTIIRPSSRLWTPN